MVLMAKGPNPRESTAIIVTHIWTFVDNKKLNSTRSLTTASFHLLFKMTAAVETSFDERRETLSSRSKYHYVPVWISCHCFSHRPLPPPPPTTPHPSKLLKWCEYAAHCVSLFTFLLMWIPPPRAPRTHAVLHPHQLYFLCFWLIRSHLRFFKLSMGIIQIPEVWNGYEEAVEDTH